MLTLLDLGVAATQGSAVIRPTQCSPVARVAQGLLRGNCSLAEGGVCFFGAVPFAAPPLGALRFRAPQPPLPWAGERDAARLGPQCLQLTDPSSPPVGNESCLFLNVWTPAACAAGGGCATMLWVHGGGYAIGSGINYDGAKDAALAKDVVVVTINYRLHALGFAAPPAGPDEATGNFGLQDQRAAMAWVRANIGAFGGGGRLTVVGESAGASSITCHLCAPASRGLFDAAAMESGAFAHWGYRPLAEAAHDFALLLNATRCATVECLRAIDAARLTAITGNSSLFGLRGGKRYAPSWAPTVDGVELPELPDTLLSRNECARLPLLLGVNRDEGTSSVGSPDEPLLARGYNMSAADLQRFFSSWLANASLVGEATRLYRVRRVKRV